MIQYPNAKINLGLNVLSRRPDHFHEIETVLIPVNLCDALEIIPAPDNSFEFSSSGLSVPGETSDNLCIRAFQLLSDELSKKGNKTPPTRNKGKHGLAPVKIHLHKIIPMGAGLGGGSSDGAFTLKILNELFELGLSLKQLNVYAGQLGSDAVFFIEDKPVFASGRGALLTNFNIDLSGYHLAVVKPDIHIATAKAYSMLSPKKPEKPLRQVVAQPMESWKTELVNDFEEAIFAEFPIIREIKQKLYEAGAVYASLSGSGSALFGIFGETPDIKDFFPDCYTWVSKF